MSIEKIKALLGEKGFTDNPSEIEPFVTAWRGGHKGKAALVAFPSSVKEVSEIIRICHAAAIPVTAQGGNTGLVGGGVPDASGKGIVLSLSRMNKIREVSPENSTITAEAGVILSNLQDYAAEKGFLFPLSMASEGSAQVGGFVSTNAGGTAVLRYGTTRELVLGLEAVLADGSIYSGLGTLRKDNTGYDVKQLFIGSEGTLGIITAACFKLFPLPKQTQTAFTGVDSVASAIQFFSALKNECSEFLSAFEMISDKALELTCTHLPDAKLPLQKKCPYYCLIELSTTSEAVPLRSIFEDILSKNLEKKIISDAALAESGKQQQAFWYIRENISEAEKKTGKGMHFDISLPISNIALFIKEADEKITALSSDIIILPFGHMGDGNIHYNLCLPASSEVAKKFVEIKQKAKEIVYALLEKYSGSISAEHGIGVERKEDLLKVKDEVALQLMKALKRNIDRKNILNPGKVIDL